MLKRSSMFGAWLRMKVSTSAAMSMTSSMLLPWLNWRSCDEVPMTTSSPSTPVSSAILASSLWQRMWVRMRACRPSPTIVLTSSRQPGDASGEVSSRYSTPKPSKAMGDADLLLTRELGADKLLAFAQGRFDDVVVF